MGRWGDWIDIHVTRAHKIVALIVGLISLITSAVVGITVAVRWIGDEEKSEPEPWQAQVSDAASPTGWYPARPTYRHNVAIEGAALNSVSDNPSYGDERNFTRVRDVTIGTAWTDDVTVVAGHEYQVAIYFHNDSTSNSLKYAYARMDIPPVLHSDGQRDENSAFGYVGASNVQPSELKDAIYFVNKTGGDVELRYRPGTARIETTGAVNNTALSIEALLSEDGVKLGLDALDGNLPPKADGKILLSLVADQPNFWFENRLRLAGTEEWKRKVTAPNGSRVQFVLSYKNTGTTVQKNVVFKFDWNENLTYVLGSTTLSAGEKVESPLGDNITQGGYNIGDYYPGAAAYLRFDAIINGTACQKVKTLGAAETNNGFRRGLSTITIEGPKCS
ncbi:DUF11 domain-containing protein [Mycobacterium sp. NS-7484]|uniref:DUF11 domain-containing protein n=1 Tax=Mycobacterium sp. NS-7484 TaxID=1834161 RepID=UPI0011515D81|nr:DUF11 domain-containing protein [Mycobacterium sp. NS-7484]